MRRTPAATPASATPGDQADIAGAPHMGAAAQLDRPAERVAAALAHRDDAHLVAVFLAEQRARAGGARIVERHQPRGHRRILQHEVVGDVLDLLDLLRRHRLRMREVEAQPVGRDQRALLRDVIAEHLAQRLVQQMRRRMVAADGAAARVIDLERKRGAGLQRALLHRADVHEQVAGLLLRVGDAEAHAVGGHHAGVADLAAGLAIERRLVDDHRAALAAFERGDLLAVAAPARRPRLRRSRSRSRGIRWRRASRAARTTPPRSRHRRSPSRTRAPSRSAAPSRR